MILCDANVLIYAFRADSADHERYREWLLGVVGGDGAYAVSPQVLSALVRIATHPRIFAQPSTTDEALAFCAALLAPPTCVVLVPGPRHWGIFCNLCRQSGAKGNLVPDAYLAALAVEHGCEWITTDRDFARFPGLRWRLPF
jgi:toxin-antitoxin system PIN domain toxin